ncbi:TIGR02757 family protein [Campylobacter sp. MIT 21-1685]|uniref:TIGR02757 family protein n=1 Tax=unclassified Campylobacter TaxID=2593542 RepID=UPI00224B3015|nr:MULTISPECIES: TIGR02757 family protein [unclassified Campylobacter]MCX2683242.1 TIGR02757 family protein [Campylobacter sp. MIT 21-1684]MCX2751565.1 TIGR02757 family protein [Campylobacter sp. MIT 21-1682]MCX2807764.1 TIGR02757 family protein [Campylobacter sp. MIT 21-1685]
MIHFTSLEQRLEQEVLEKNTLENLLSADDPLQVARRQKNQFAILLCALFSYGNAKNIVNFLQKLDFSLLDLSEKQIQKALTHLKYRFQNEEDVKQIFITLRRMQNEDSLENFFTKAYLEKGCVLYGIKNFLFSVWQVNKKYSSYGYDFFFGRVWRNVPNSPLKRYNMFLRWMVRKDRLDLGLFERIHTKDLFMPLDIHTHRVSLKLGLLKRKTYDFKAVVELTNNLKKFDSNDPLKYDFALYRLGQSGRLDEWI